MRKWFGLSTLDDVRRCHTSLPVGRIGDMVGIDDPHLFNTTIRRELCKAPRELRELG